MNKLYQCPYDAATRCAMNEKYAGCEQFKPAILSNHNDVIKLEQPENIEIKWKYFFGGSYKGRSFRYYFAIINDVRCEMHNKKYCIGNFDHAKIKYNSEKELIQAVNKLKT